MKVFVDNAPSFYRIKHFNKIAEEISISVIYTEQSDYDNSRNADFFKGESSFEVVQLSKPLWKKIVEVYSFLSNHKIEELIISGWGYLGDWILLIMSPKRKNSCIIESSIIESDTTGIKGLIKRLFLKKCSKVYAAGKAQAALARALGFKGQVVISGGCGLLDYKEQPPFKERKEVKTFLYVGRLIELKNLKLLISVFNEHPELKLIIVGFGEQETELKSLSKENIEFRGAVDNKDLWHIYREADVFVLPSKSETWGLVVEEALNNGTPVIVSDRVGCKDDLVSENTGLVFCHNSKEDLKHAVNKITDVDYYNKLRFGVSKLDFYKRAEHQVEVFI